MKVDALRKEALVLTLSLRNIGSENATARIQSMGLTNGSGSRPLALRSLFSARTRLLLASQWEKCLTRQPRHSPPSGACP
jgi:hypothetical protein